MNPRGGGVNLLFGIIFFAENYRKMKKIILGWDEGLHMLRSRI